jgi:hypothetical protein
VDFEEDVLLILELTLGKYLRYKLDDITKYVKQKLKENCLAKSGD